MSFSLMEKTKYTLELFVKFILVFFFGFFLEGGGDCQSDSTEMLCKKTLTLQLVWTKNDLLNIIANF